MQCCDGRGPPASKRSYKLTKYLKGVLGKWHPTRNSSSQQYRVLYDHTREAFLKSCIQDTPAASIDWYSCMRTPCSGLTKTNATSLATWSSASRSSLRCTLCSRYMKIVKANIRFARIPVLESVIHQRHLIGHLVVCEQVLIALHTLQPGITLSKQMSALMALGNLIHLRNLIGHLVFKEEAPCTAANYGIVTGNVSIVSAGRSPKRIPPHWQLGRVRETPYCAAHLKCMTKFAVKDLSLCSTLRLAF
eukprot:1161913-Pelagomonas_calceolata.AAC.10